MKEESKSAWSIDQARSVLDLTRQEVRHIDNLLASRTNWFLTTQAFLLAAFVSLYQRPEYVAAVCVGGAVIMGFLAALLSLVSVVVAQYSIGRWNLIRDDVLIDYPELEREVTSRWHRPLARIDWLDFLEVLLHAFVPLALCGFWGFLSAIYRSPETGYTVGWPVFGSLGAIVLASLIICALLLLGHVVRLGKASRAGLAEEGKRPKTRHGLGSVGNRGRDKPNDPPSQHYY